MILAIIIGLFIGVLSYSPYVVATFQSAKQDAEKSQFGLLGWFLFAILVSFVVLIASIIICKLVAPDVAIPFAIASIGTLFVCVIIFSLIMPKVRGKKNVNG